MARVEFFSITSNGLKPLKGLPFEILPGRVYPMGASDTPMDVMVLSVTDDQVRYRGLYADRPQATPRPIFEDLVYQGCKTTMRVYGDLPRGECVAALFAGVVPPAEPLTAYDRVSVKVYPRQDGVRAMDLWRVGEKYGSVGGLIDENALVIEGFRKYVMEVADDPDLLVVNVAVKKAFTAH